MWVPPACVASALAGMPAVAADYLSVAEAQRLIFPRAQFTQADLTLTDPQADELGRVSGTTVYRKQVKVWRVSTGGWFFLDQVPGREDRITYAVGVDADGSIKSIEVLACDAEYDQVRGPWSRNFVGRHYSRVHLSKAVPNISGATLSAAHIADGVTRILATYALFLAPRDG